MADDLEDFNLTGDSVDIVDVNDLVFFKHFDSNLLTGKRVSPHFYLSKGALAEVTT